MSDYFTTRTLRRGNPHSKLAYIHSYNTPKDAFLLPELYFMTQGFEVRRYDVNDFILDEADARLMLRAAVLLQRDIRSWTEADERPLFGIGNSMGSYLLRAAALEVPFEAAVFNGAGSMAEAIFGRDPKHGTAGRKYREKDISVDDLKRYWSPYENFLSERYQVQANRALVTRSLADNVIPPASGDRFVEGLRRDVGDVIELTDRRRHAASIMFQSLRVQTIAQFFADQPAAS